MLPTVTADPRRLVYESFPLAPTPPDDVALWRYTSLAKFLSIINRRSLFLSRVDRLGDPFEGSIPRPYYDGMRGAVRRTHLAEPLVDATFNVLRRERGTTLRLLRCISAASCWHRADQESAAMWDRYVGPDLGVCIRSNVSRLKLALTGNPGAAATVPYHIGSVVYRDFETDEIPDNNLLFPSFLKRREFESESEVRIVIYDASREPPGNYPEDIESLAIPGGGLNVTVAVEQLVERVVVSPGAPDAFVASVRDATVKAGFLFPVQRSTLDGEPRF